MDFLIGEIDLFPYGWAPMYWAVCEGQLLQINQNQALYALIGNTFGGSQAQNTFALPNLKGAEPIPGVKYYICTMGLFPQRD